MINHFKQRAAGPWTFWRVVNNPLMYLPLAIYFGYLGWFYDRMPLRLAQILAGRATLTTVFVTAAYWGGFLLLAGVYVGWGLGKLQFKTPAGPFSAWPLIDRVYGVLYILCWLTLVWGSVYLTQVVLLQGVH